MSICPHHVFQCRTRVLTFARGGADSNIGERLLFSKYHERQPGWERKKEGKKDREIKIEEKRTRKREINRKERKEEERERLGKRD